VLEGRTSSRIILIIIGIITGLFLFIAGCAPQSNDKVIIKKAPNKIEDYQVGIVLSKKNQGNINQQVLLGANNAIAKSTNIELNIIKPKDFVDAEESIRYLAENSYNLIIAVGEDEGKVANVLAKEYGNSFFAVTQVPSGGSNVISLNYNLEEGIALTGALAALLSVDNQVAFIGHKDNSINLTNKFAYVQGINDINITFDKQVKLIVRNLDNPKDITALNSQLASLINAKVDYYLLSSPDGNQTLYKLNKDMLKNLSKPVPAQLGYPYASVVKKMNPVIYNLIINGASGKRKLEGGNVFFGIKGGSVALQYTDPTLIPPPVSTNLKATAQKIETGYLKVK
jgi:basic membrane lipoprotein Med (substrate-binding protein (PBP1-ABC) superfamily)